MRTSLLNQVAVVTGAGSGIGKAIAKALTATGAIFCLVGWTQETLEETADAIRTAAPRVVVSPTDLTLDNQVEQLRSRLETEFGQVDILVHSAGVIHQDLMERARIENFDIQYATNVRAPYLVTQRLLPLLTTARGQIVFINSSVGLTAKRPEVGQYGATKQALKAIADSLREGVNPKGIRVLTVYLGRTATPMQEALYRQEGRLCHSEVLLQPEDVASMVVQALMLPTTAEVTDISIRPMIKS